MRKEGQLIVLFTILLYSSVAWGSLCGLDEINSFIRILDAPVQTMIISDDYKTIFLLTTSGTLYKSSDKGVVFLTQQEFLKDSLEPSMQGDPIIVRSIIKTKSNRIYILGESAVYWTSSPDADSYKAFYRYLIDVQPHPDNGDCALATGMADSCSTGKDCYTYLLVTENFGESWTTIRNYIFSWGWGSGETIYTISVNETLQTGSQFTILQSDRRFYILKNYGDTIAFESPTGYTNFIYSHNFLYVTVLNEDKNLELIMSSNGGNDFYKADFIDPVLDSMPNTQSNYQILDNSDLNTFINVQLTNDMRYGAIYEADSYDAEYWISLRYNRIDAAKKAADFSKYQGLSGIYYANRYNISSYVPVNNIEPFIETVVTFDKGGVWERIAVPENSNCTDENCALHLYGPVDRNLPQILTDVMSVGLVLATGNEGVYRSIRLDNTGTYLSRNTGFTWERIRDGVNQYAWGDHGGLFLLATVENPTNQISYSWNQGLTWTDCEFSDDQYWDVSSVNTLGNATSRTFILLGSHENSGVVAIFDLTNTMTTPCTGESTPTLEDSDYEVFTPMTAGGCLNGRQESYVRRKRDAVCFNGESFDKTIYDVVNCPCTREDYECDGECFEEMRDQETGETTCFNVCYGQDPLATPENCTGVIQITQGYRKVEGDTCTGGLDLDPINYDCSPSASNSTANEDPDYTYDDNIISIVLLFGIFVTVFIIIGIIVLFIVYRKNDSLNAALSPYIPAWCVKQDEDGDNYGKIDSSTTNSLLDDELFE